MADEERLAELLKSHDELHIICQRLWRIILDNDLTEDVIKTLNEAKIQEGFSARAVEVEKRYHRERLLLMASGRIQ